MEHLSPERALEQLAARQFLAIVIDFPLGRWTPAGLLERVRQLSSGAPVLIRDPRARLADAVRLARLGACQCIGAGDDAFALVEEAIEERRSGQLERLSQAVREDWEHLLVGESSEMRRVGHVIRMVGSRRATVLITGETGTGKEVAARALHMAGPRRRAALVAVNCNALPEHLLEAELFGHVKGAFTGAFQSRVGRLEQAQGGTLFLDEIGDLPMEFQAKLLRVLQEREFQRLGSSETIPLDVRIVAATNADLARRIDQGRFREDLYYRLNVVPLSMPPLRERTSDIPILAAHFLEKVCRAEGIPLKRIAPEALARLTGYSWPGNVRQLENAVEMAAALSGDRLLLAPDDFPLGPEGHAPGLEHDAQPVISVPDDGLDYERTLALIERSILDQALAKTGGNKKAAAEMLRLKRTTLSAKIRSLDSAGVLN
jgi:DNA-binding NtrC family response regulator